MSHIAIGVEQLGSDLSGLASWFDENDLKVNDTLPSYYSTPDVQNNVARQTV
jgi:hypothetical protein